MRGGLGEDGRVSEVDAGVEVDVGPGGNLVARQDNVLLTVARHLRTVRPQPSKLGIKKTFYLTKECLTSFAL